MKFDTQFTLSTSWVIFTCLACTFAGAFTMRLAFVVCAVGLLHMLLSMQLRWLLASRTSAQWPGLEAAAAVISWATLSLIVLCVAMLSRWLVTGVAVVLVCYLVCRRDSKLHRAGDPQADRVCKHGSLIVATVGGAFALYLALPALLAMQLGYRAYDTAIWIDAPFHASYVSALAHALTEGEYVDIHGRGLPVQLYHQGSYAIAGLLSAVAGVPSLTMVQVSTAWGGVWLALSLYSLVTCFVSRAEVAVFAALFALFVPDTGLLPGGHGLFGFHWLLQVASASSVALALMLVALAILVRGCETRNWHFVALGWTLALCVVAFKAHIFVVAAVPLFVYPVLVWKGLSVRARFAGVCAQLTLVAAVTKLASEASSLPLIRFDFSASGLWLTSVAQHSPQWIKAVLLDASGASTLVAGAYVVVVLSAALYGLWALLAGISLLRWPLSVRLPQRALFGLAAAFILTSVGLSADNRMATGGPLEFHFQGQIWGYACFAAGAAIIVGEAVYARIGRAGLFGVLFVALVGFVWAVPPSAALQRVSAISIPSLAVGPNNAEVATLRSALTSCDTILVADGDPWFLWQAALETPSWVTDYALNPNHRAVVRDRLNEMSKPRMDYESWMRSNGITWYVRPSESGTNPLRTTFVPPRPADVLGTHFSAWQVQTATRHCR